MLGGALIRDAAVMAAIFGVTGFAWLGWAQEGPPPRWRLPLGVGSVLSVLTGMAGAFLAYRHWGPDSALATESARESFGIVAGIELGSAAVGAGILAVRRQGHWISAWVCLVVGAHFVPLAFIFDDAGLHLLAGALVLVSMSSVVLSRRTGIQPSAIVGAGAGVVLWLFSVRSLLAVLTG